MKLFPVVCVAGLIIAQSSSAAVVESYSVGASVTVDGGAATSDTGQPVASVTKTQNFTGPGGFVDVLTGSATQNIDGFSSVEVNVAHSGFDATAANGDIAEHSAIAIANRTIRYTNTSATTAFLGTFDFRLSGMYLEVFNGGGGPTIPEASIGYSVRLTLDNSGPKKSSVLTLTGDYNNFQLQTDGGLSGPISQFDCFGSTCQRASVTVDPYSGSLNLGVLAPGESVNVYTSFFVTNKWNGTEIGALARGLDPNGGSAAFTPVGPQPSPVPLPASGLMLLGALFGAAQFARRKTRRT